MRPQIRHIDKHIEVLLEGECILTVDHTFAKSELISWEVSSKQDFFDRFYPLEERYALRVALIKLSRKAMHSEQVKCVLAERYFSYGAIESALEELSRLGVINDEDFEAYFVKKLQKQGKSRHQIVSKATQKGIPAKKLADLFGPEQETLKALIEKKYPVLLDKNAPYSKKQKAMGALYRRGFATSTISCTIKDFNV